MDRREFTKTFGTLTVSILTLPVLPSMARAGSDTPGQPKDSAWQVFPVVPDEGGLFIPPTMVGNGSWLVYPNGNTYNFQTGKQWVFMGVFGSSAVTPVSFPEITLGSNAILLVPNL